MAATCRACGAPLVWIQTPSKKWMPCDEGLVAYKQTEDGKDAVVTQDGEVIRCPWRLDGNCPADKEDGDDRR